MTTADSTTQRRRTLGGWIRDSRLASTAIDDRGHKVRLLDPVRMQDAPAVANPAAAARLAWARAEMRAGNFGLRWGLVMFLCWVAFPVLDGNDAPAVVWSIALPVWLVLVWRLNRLIARRGNAKRTHRVGSLLASHGLCPTCAYSLADLSPEADGCTVCPECGGAWKRVAIAASGPALPGSPRLTRAGWRRRLPRGLIPDDRRESHPVVRLPPEDLLSLAWTQAQRSRLRSALDAARLSGLITRRRLAGLFIALAVLHLVIAGMACTLVAKVLTDWPVPVGTGIRLTLLVFPMTMVVFPLAQTAFMVLEARKVLGPRGWLAPIKGYACLPRHGFCAACINDLTDLPAEPDGCTICPECGAAWKLGNTPSEAPTTP